MMNPLINVDNIPIKEIDTIFNSPYIRDESSNAKQKKKKKTYSREAKNLPMAKYIVNNNLYWMNMPLFTFTQEEP